MTQQQGVVLQPVVQIQLLLVNPLKMMILRVQRVHPAAVRSLRKLIRLQIKVDIMPRSKLRKVHQDLTMMKEM